MTRLTSSHWAAPLKVVAQTAPDWVPQQLPSITDLTAQTGLAVGTVRRGIDLLVKEGLVQTVPGRGTFVKR
jgi:GntR family transcriptional regulator